MSNIECPYRDQIIYSAGLESARCGLLQQIVGADQPSRYRVGADACLACTQTIRPSLGRLNTVVASFLYTITDQILEQGGVTGCDVEKATNLHRWAESALELQLQENTPPLPAVTGRTHCHYLGTRVGNRVVAAANGHARVAVFQCKHPAYEQTTLANCQTCRDWTVDPQQDPPPPLTLFESQKSQSRGRSMRWAVGITTAPREVPTLDRCLESLQRAGWQQPRLFVDGRIDRPYDLPVTLRDPAVGAWPNYYLALMELLQREPDADALMVVQDDAVFYDRVYLKDCLDQVLWLADPPGLVSLYCSSAYTMTQSGWHRCAERWNWGALAIVFPRALAVRFLTDEQALEHRWQPYGDRYIDDVIGDFCIRHDIPIHYPCPSLVQHIGESSTLWPGVTATGYRRASQFAGG